MTTGPDTRRVSIDGGQSGSRVRVAIDGTTTDRDDGPIFTSRPVVEQVAEIARRALADAPVQATTLTAGVSGLTPDQSRPERLLALTADLGVDSVFLVHDSVSAYLGANGFDHGVVTAVGTGVVTLGVGDLGTARIDGWGHLLGDAGSAYWIGRAGLDAALRSFDGRSVPTSLERAAVDEFGELPELYMRLQGAPDHVASIAGFARIVGREADSGDGIAVGILRDAAIQLATSVIAALRRTGWHEGDASRVSWMGAVLSRNDMLRQHLRDEISTRAQGAVVQAPLGTSLDGVEKVADTPPGHPLDIEIYRAG